MNDLAVWLDGPEGLLLLAAGMVVLFVVCVAIIARTRTTQDDIDRGDDYW